METIYTVTEVAEYLKISKSKLYRLVQTGRLPYIKIGRNVRILESDLLEWIEENYQPNTQGLGLEQSP